MSSAPEQALEYRPSSRLDVTCLALPLTEELRKAGCKQYVSSIAPTLKPLRRSDVALL